MAIFLIKSFAIFEFFEDFKLPFWISKSERFFAENFFFWFAEIILAKAIFSTRKFQENFSIQKFRALNY